MIKKSQIILGAMVMAFLLGPKAAFGLDQVFLSSLDRVVNQIDSLFPSLEGYVVSIEGDELLLDLKKGEPVGLGDKLKLIRFGKEIIHPVTKKKLGRKERELGNVEVIRIGKNFSRAKVVEQGVKARVGDGFRSPFKKLSFLIAPITAKTTSKRVDRNRLMLELEKKLNAHPRFNVPIFDLEVWMLESSLNNTELFQPKNLDRLREKVKADYILVSEVRSVGGKLVLSYKMISAQDGSVKNQGQVLSEKLPLLPQAPRSPAEQEIQADFSPRKKMVEFVFKQEFPFEIVDFDIGDINGDGIKEYIIIDRYRIMFYKLVGSSLKRITQIKTKKKINYFISVDVADINGNGRDEIFVTNKLGDRLSSFVIEGNYKWKRFKKIWDKVPLYFRIIHPLGDRPTLMAQRPGFINPFAGGIKTILFRRNKYAEGPSLKVPSIYGKQFILYGLTQLKVGEKEKKHTFILDKDYNLRVYSSTNRLIVQSDEYYGHDPRMIDIGVKEDTPGLDQQGEPVNYRGRLLLVKNGDRKFLLIPKNYRLGGSLLGKLVVINNSSLVILKITKEGLEKVFETKKQKGYIAAFQVLEPLNSREKKISVVAVEPGGLTGKTISTIFTYNWLN